MLDTTNIVQVSSIQESRITHVSLYSGLAEITRFYKVKLKAGDNKVVISDLPTKLVEDSLRVEGRGPCTIHEVAISQTPIVAVIQSTPKLTDLYKEKTRVQKALDRKRNAIEAIGSFYNSLTVEHVDAAELVKTTRQLQSVHAELDEKVLKLEEELTVLEQQIRDERRTLNSEVKGDKYGQLSKRASITMAAEKDTDVELVLVYGVRNATWTPMYDIFAKVDTKEKAVTLIYKATILQNTGEVYLFNRLLLLSFGHSLIPPPCAQAWDDVSLTLETAIPTFGLSIPQLIPWTLSTYRPPPPPPPIVLPQAIIIPDSRSPSRRRRCESGSDSISEDCEDYSRSASMSIDNRDFFVSSKGDINASFSVPGLISIPSDNDSHNVTIVELPLDALVSWISIPKKEAKAHLTAKIKNDSDYSFLRGVASIYVDGSFISRSDVPDVSPQESFDCPLGIDLTIRIVYHPRTKKIRRSGPISFTGKTTSYVFDQRITVYNTKSVPITGLKILDQIPVSDNSKMIVNLTNPPLTLPQLNKKGFYVVPQGVAVGSQTFAQWKGTDESDVDPSLLGQDGEFSWVCNIPAQGTLNLLLSWEVLYPRGSHAVGLDM